MRHRRGLSHAHVGSLHAPDAYALEPDELAPGVVLTCRAHPTTPEVRLTYL